MTTHTKTALSCPYLCFKLLIMKYFALFVGLLMFIACQSPARQEATAESASANGSAENSLPNDKGLRLMESYCFSCHSPEGEHDNRIAPPMIAIKKHYIQEGTSLEEFVEALSSFVLMPSEEKSKMPGAVKRFGLMPTMNFSQEDLSAIAEYIYAADLEEPEWFKKHQEEMHGKGKGMGQHSAHEEALSPAEQGKKMAMTTKAILGKNLMGAIQQRGTDGAISFCNIEAILLTDSMATVQNAQIKRVSDRNRNPNNAANSSELAYINKAKEQLVQGEDIFPYFEEVDGHKRGFYPILTNQMCLQCHGRPQIDIAPSTLALLRDLYPNDQAVGYGENELRGIWVVDWD